jgi:hypothetical protein
MKLLLSVCLCIWGSAATATDLPLGNPGFEVGPQQQIWALGTNGPCTSPGNAPAIYDANSGDPANVRTGRYSLRLTYNSEKAWQLVPVGLLGLCRVTLSGWVKTATPGSTATKILTFEFNGMDANSNCIWQGTSAATLVGPYPDWTRVEVSFDVPVQVPRLVVALHTQNGPGCLEICDQPIYVDDLSLISICGQTPAETGTWGGLKELYRP